MAHLDPEEFQAVTELKVTEDSQEVQAFQV